MLVLVLRWTVFIGMYLLRYVTMVTACVCLAYSGTRGITVLVSILLLVSAMCNELGMAISCKDTDPIDVTLHTSLCPTLVPVLVFLVCVFYVL